MTGSPNRDDVARIIEPEAFAELCRIGDEDAYWEDQEKKDAALKKADAIIALFSATPPVEGKSK